MVVACKLSADQTIVAAWYPPGYWLILGGAFYGSVTCLAEYEGYLFVGGSFFSVGGLATSRIAAWNGQSWRPVGEGCDGRIVDMVSWNDRLWIGGDFSTAGGVVAIRLTNWRGFTPLAAEGIGAAPPLLEAPRPNPFNPRTTLRFRMLAAGRVDLAVFDLRGRLVRRLVDGEFPAGPHEVDWDGRDGARRAAPAGIYIARLRSGSHETTVRLALVR
jgi:hypothetical protein